MTPTKRNTAPATYMGEHALRDFLDPSKGPVAPLVELPACLNPFRKDGVRIFAKLMSMLPLGNVKAIPAYNIVNRAKDNKKLSGVHTIVEYSSGNTILSAVIAARNLGIRKSKALVSHFEVPQHKMDMLRFFGIEIEVHHEPLYPKPFDKRSGVTRAVSMGTRKGYFCPRQFENEDNPSAHRHVTGPQVWEQMGGDIDIFCAGIGTTGTIKGTSEFLKCKDSTIHTIGVLRPMHDPVPGVNARDRLGLIQYDWHPYVDAVEEVTTKDSYTQSLLLCREGLLVGPSTGFAYQGLLQFLQKEKEAGSLKKYKNKKGEVRCVFICPDGPFQYLSEYFTYVDKKYLPKVKISRQALQEGSKIG